jgi:hypothetical protein
MQLGFFRYYSYPRIKRVKQYLTKKELEIKDIIDGMKLAFYNGFVFDLHLTDYAETLNIKNVNRLIRANG